jgi:hypothetical protein
MRYSTHLPDLRIVPVEHLLLHETSDERRITSLAERLQKENRLKNPPAVTPLPDGDDYMVLDGANRVSAFKMLGIPHIVAQLVSYDDPDVELNAWNHVIAGMPEAQFRTALEELSNLHLEQCSIQHARQSIAIGDAIAYVICRNAVCIVKNKTPAADNDIRLLNDLVNIYKGKADIYRASNDDFSKQAPSYPDITALVVFPSFRPADLIAFVRLGEVVPSGITRHIIPQRALRINIPLAVLAEERPLSEKKDWLNRWWHERLTANAIRFYAESTFLFDE